MEIKLFMEQDLMYLVYLLLDHTVVISYVTLMMMLMEL